MLFIVFFSLSFILCPDDTYSLIPYVAILQEKKLLDLPKLLDICAIYSHENEDLTRVLVGIFVIILFYFLLEIAAYIFATHSLPLSHLTLSLRWAMQ